MKSDEAIIIVYRHLMGNPVDPKELAKARKIIEVEKKKHPEKFLKSFIDNAGACIFGEEK